MSPLSYIMEALKNTIDKINSFEFEIQVKSELTGEYVTSVKKKNTNGKPFVFETNSPLVQWVRENINPDDNNLQVRMHRNSVPNNSNPTVGESSIVSGNVESSLNRGTKRTWDDLVNEGDETSS